MYMLCFSIIKTTTDTIFHSFILALHSLTKQCFPCQSCCSICTCMTISFFGDYISKSVCLQTTLLFSVESLIFVPLYVRLNSPRHLPAGWKIHFSHLYSMCPSQLYFSNNYSSHLFQKTKTFHSVIQLSDLIFRQAT